MTKKIVLRGHVDVRVLDAKDLEKAGVEGFKKTPFLLDVPREVEDDVAEALLGDAGMFGKFEEVKPEEAQSALFDETIVSAPEPAKNSKSSK